MPPIQLLLTRRLLLAKQLLTETTLPITEVAFASGFSSLRRFNDAFTRRYGMAPTRLRAKATDGRGRCRPRARTSTLLLAYRPPYDWPGIARVPRGARARRRRARDRRRLRPHRAARQGQGLDPGDAEPQEARARSRVPAHVDPGAARAA